MARLKILAALIIAVGTLALAASAPALAAQHNVYSFDLTSGDTATAPATGMMAAAGDWIWVKGSGTFDPAAHSVKAGGRFVHYTAAGLIHCQGTWKATGLTSFADFGTNADGNEGGVLSLVVSHYCSTMGMTMTGIPMTVTAAVNAPAGTVTGVTMGDFTVPTQGRVVMQPQQ